MGLTSWSVRVAAGVAVASLLTLAWAAGTEEGAPASIAVMGPDGTALLVAPELGVTPATWQAQPVLVFVVNASILEGVEAHRGEGEATRAVALAGGLRLFVLSAKSTFLGCTVGFNAELGASLDVADYDGDGRVDSRLLDPCHHGQWDAFHDGRPVVGFAPERLSALHVELRDGVVFGTGFDGNVGPSDDW
jgi:Rieske Fe-S protein